MAYKFKVMTEEQVNEVQELWDNGHAEALAAYGVECFAVGREGYKRLIRRDIRNGLITGALVATATIGVMGLIGIIAEAVEKKADKNQIEEQQDYEE